MKDLAPADLAFVLDAFERRGQFSVAPTGPTGLRRAVVEASLGYHDATRLAALLGATEPRKNGTRWRVRMKGENAEAVLRDLHPFFSESSRDYADKVLTRAARLRERREARKAAAQEAA